METLIECIRKCNKYADVAQRGYAEHQLMEFFLDQIKESGAYLLYVREWNAKPANKKTYKAMKMHFLAAQKARRELGGTAGSTGYVNHMTGTFENAMNQFAKGVANQRAEQATLYESNANLQAKVEAQTAKINQLVHDIQQMQMTQSYQINQMMMAGKRTSSNNNR